ncbi:MAG: MarR family transcriptional regulator [Gemmatimonadaceae bacterium]|nr:MarR family transcriptional regulator [Gemmatimonadaceae bacterium]
MIADRLHSAAIHLLRRLRKEDGRAGISAARLSALSVAVFAGPVTMGQLAAAEHVAAPTMTRLIAGMEREGLVERDRDFEDGRVVWIRATAKGTRILCAARDRRLATLTADLDALDPADLRLLAAAAGVIERLGSES